MRFEVLLLLAMPAAGKSEIRRYLSHLDRAGLATLGLGAPVQLDDYPYVHLMHLISSELRALGRDPIFFATDRSRFSDPEDWGTLIHLLNQDYRAVTGESGPKTGILERIDRARRAAGVGPAFVELPASIVARIERAVEGSVPRLRPTAHGTTVLIEFARGGPPGAELPLPAPIGYGHSLRLLDPSILARAAILYVWVTPEESNRRNRERARPGADGESSILHHDVPEVVMHEDYGCDDLFWLAQQSDRPGTVAVEAGGERYHLPLAVFDNRTDTTSFLRSDPREWPKDAVGRIHRRLAEALGAAATAVSG
jgi:hypothetical protein